MVPEYELLRFAIRGSTIIKTFLTEEGEENEEIFMIGGLGTKNHLKGQFAIRKLKKEDDEFRYRNRISYEFKSIPTKLKHGRAYHIALPISYDLVKESCKGPSSRGKYEVLIVLSVFSVFLLILLVCVLILIFKC